MLVVIKGAGDIATGIALRLHRARFRIVMTDIARPTAIRRTVSFCEAVPLGETTVEGVAAELAQNAAAAREITARGRVAVLVDPQADCVRELQPDALVDAVLAKRNLGTGIADAPVVIGVGPGFTAGEDCHAVVETQRGHTLGRVIMKGAAAPNTGVPGNIGGYTVERLLRAPTDGIFHPALPIGALVQPGQPAGYVDGVPMVCGISGILRGILPDGTPVQKGMKSGDIDPRCKIEHCFTASDKALSVGGGVLEAILRLTPLCDITLRGNGNGTGCKTD